MFKFNISISERGYKTKQEAIASLPYYIDKENKIVNDKVCYLSRQTLTVPQLAEYLRQGHTVCGVFEGPKRFTSTAKKADKFKYTHTLFYDIDNAPCPMNELLEIAPYKPTIAYRTFSDGNKGNRYRFVYVVEDYVNAVNFSYVYERIADVCKLPPTALDKLPYAQCYFGTDKSDFAIAENAIYSFQDFGIEDVVTTEDDCVTIEGFPVKYHSDLILSENKHYYTYPSDYYAVWHKFGYDKERKRPAVIRIKDGEGRRKHLWKTGQVLMYLNPTMSKGILFKALQYELGTFYDNTTDIIPLHGSNRSLESIAENVFVHYKDYPLKPSRHGEFKINTAYWKAEMNKGNNVYNPIVAVAKCRHEITRERIAEHFDPTRSIKENLQVLKEKGMKVSSSTLYRYRQELMNSSDFSQTYNYSPTDKNIIILMKKNELIRISEIAQSLNLSESKVKRIIGKLENNDVIKRDGNKRNYKWVVLIDIAAENR